MVDGGGGFCNSQFLLNLLLSWKRTVKSTTHYKIRIQSIAPCRAGISFKLNTDSNGDGGATQNTTVNGGVKGVCCGEVPLRNDKSLRPGGASETVRVAYNRQPGRHTGCAELREAGVC